MTSEQTGCQRLFRRTIPSFHMRNVSRVRRIWKGSSSFSDYPYGPKGIHLRSQLPRSQFQCRHQGLFECSCRLVRDIICCLGSRCTCGAYKTNIVSVTLIDNWKSVLPDIKLLILLLIVWTPEGVAVSMRTFPGAADSITNTPHQKMYYGMYGRGYFDNCV